MGPLNFSSYKKIFLTKRINSKLFFNKFIYSNSIVIPQIFSNTKVSIYNGRHWNKKFISRYTVGFKAGEFVWTRKIAVFKNKQKSKKKK
jgi:ribosomal protein S19